MLPTVNSISDSPAPKRFAARHATTLVEVLVVATLTSMLFVILTTLAVQMRQWDRQMRDNSIHGDQSAQLAEALRADAAGGNSLKLTKNDTLIINTPDLREIRYTLEPDGVRREVTTAANTPQATSTFTIGPAESWKIEPGPAGRNKAFAISLERPESGRKLGPFVPLFVYAVLGHTGDK